MRQLYESDVDRNNEARVMHRLADVWKADYQKLPIRYGVDYAVTKGRRVGGWVEVKCRNKVYPEMALSLAKWQSGVALSKATGVPFVLAYGIQNKIYYRVCSVDETPEIVMLGRWDRNDWQDAEPMVLFNTEEFKVIDANQ